MSHNTISAYKSPVHSTHIAAASDAGTAVDSRVQKAVVGPFNWNKMTFDERKVYFSRLCGEPEEQMTESISPGSAEDLQQKSSHMWDCVGFAEGIYALRMKRQYDPSSEKDPIKKANAAQAFRAKTHEISPAIEISFQQAKTFLDTTKADQITFGGYVPGLSEEAPQMSLRDAYIKYGLKLFKCIPNDQQGVLMALIYEELGYGIRDNDKTLFLPTIETLRSRWAVLQQKNPGLADLDVIVTNGIASDDAYMQHYFIYITLLSNDKEFLHDHVIHVRTQLQLLCMSAGMDNDFNEYKNKIVDELFAMYKQILLAEQNPSLLDLNFLLSSADLTMLKKSMGALIDTITSNQSQINPRDLAAQVRTILQDKDGPFYRVAVAEFDVKNLERIPLLWAQLALATAPVFGYPKTMGMYEPQELLTERPNLLAVIDSTHLHFRSESLPYKIIGEDKLVVDQYDIYFEKRLGGQHHIPLEVLKELLAQIEQNEMKLAQLIESYPVRLQENGSVQQSEPVDPAMYEVGSYMIVRAPKGVQPDLTLKRVDVNSWTESWKIFDKYSLASTIKRNQPGFQIIDSSDPSKSFFVPAESYADFTRNLSKYSREGLKFGEEIAGV